MNLNSYLILSKTKPADFAMAVGVTVFAVGKWRRGERMPRPQHLKKINAITQGAVTANDFFSAQKDRAA